MIVIEFEGIDGGFQVRVLPCGGVAFYDWNTRRWSGETWSGRTLISAMMSHQIGHDSEMDAMAYGADKVPESWVYSVHGIPDELQTLHQDFLLHMKMHHGGVQVAQLADNEYLLVDATDTVIATVYQAANRTHAAVRDMAYAPILLSACVRMAKPGNSVCRIQCLHPDHNIPSINLLDKRHIDAEIQALMEGCGPWSYQTLKNAGLLQHVSLEPYIKHLLPTHPLTPDF